MQYWDMTYGEILTEIRGSEARRRANLQEQALIAYRQSELTSTLVSIILGGRQKVPSITEAFPGIFPEQEQTRQQNWQLMKARIEQFAAARRKRGEKADGGDHA